MHSENICLLIYIASIVKKDCLAFILNNTNYFDTNLWLIIQSFPALYKENLYSLSFQLQN